VKRFNSDDPSAQRPVRVNVVDTAKLVRTALRKAFTGVSFRVRVSRYANGASIDVLYVDGPRVAKVRRVTESFTGKVMNGEYFDPMARPAIVEGQPGAVQYGADHISVTRRWSPAFVQQVASEVAAGHGQGPPPVCTTPEGGAYVDAGPLAHIIIHELDHRDAPA
jgi:hypothetical protein